MEERLHRRDAEMDRVQEEVIEVTKKFEESGDVIRKLENEIQQHIEKYEKHNVAIYKIVV